MAAVSLALLYSITGVVILSRFRLIEAYWTDTWMAGVLIFLISYDLLDDWNLGDSNMVAISCAKI